MSRCPFCEKPIAAGSASCPHCRAPLEGMLPSGGESLEERVRALLDADQKIEAVKLYREETAASLAEAKEAVEALQAGRGLPVETPKDAAGIESEVLRLLGQRKKIEAIKLYRQHAGGGLKEAKEAVEALGERHGLDVRGSGCLGVVLCLVLCWSAVVAWFAA
ncbi:MAG: hypothetical protein KDA41_05110 [Planctomycetales bacterium]|nr:hypothetical protein [Planctomycetales bacterium]